MDKSGGKYTIIAAVITAFATILAVYLSKDQKTAFKEQNQIENKSLELKGNQYNSQVIIHENETSMTRN